jgi:hypothetical protein
MKVSLRKFINVESLIIYQTLGTDMIKSTLITCEMSGYDLTDGDFI